MESLQVGEGIVAEKTSSERRSSLVLTLTITNPDLEALGLTRADVLLELALGFQACGGLSLEQASRLAELLLETLQKQAEISAVNHPARRPGYGRKPLPHPRP